MKWFRGRIQTEVYPSSVKVHHSGRTRSSEHFPSSENGAIHLDRGDQIFLQGIIQRNITTILRGKQTKKQKSYLTRTRIASYALHSI